MADEVKTFDPIEHIKARNESDHAKLNPQQVKTDEPAKVVEKAADKPADDENHDKRLSRSDRRRAKVFEELGAARAKAEMLEAQLAEARATHKPVTEADPEPKRDQFTSDADYNRALGRWDARQEAKKEVGKVEEKTKAEQDNAVWFAHVKEMDKKSIEDMKAIDDWAEAQEEAEDAADEDESLKFSADSQPTFWALIAQSDVRAFILHHYAKTPEDLRKILAAPAAEQIRIFSRLEGRVEKMYTSDDPKKAAQAEDKGKPEPKDRRHPADSAKPDGRNASERDALKPRPSTEVAARGGSAAPEEPAIGSRAWMEKRNAALSTTRF